MRRRAVNLTDRDATLASVRRTYAEEGAKDVAILTANVALLAAHFGDVELALDAWRHALLDGEGYLQFTWTPVMAPMRKHPGFKTLMRDLGLVDYWREHGWPVSCRPLGDGDDFECS